MCTYVHRMHGDLHRHIPSQSLQLGNFWMLCRFSFWKHAKSAERQRQQQPHWFGLIGQEVSPPCLRSTTMLCERVGDSFQGESIMEWSP